MRQNATRHPVIVRGTRLYHAADFTPENPEPGSTFRCECDQIVPVSDVQAVADTWSGETTWVCRRCANDPYGSYR